VRVAHEVFSGPELVAKSVALGKIHSKYFFKQSQHIPWTPGISASAFEIGNDPELTVEPALASSDIAFGLAQMFQQHSLMHGPHHINAITLLNAQVPTKFTRTCALLRTGRVVRFGTTSGGLSGAGQGIHFGGSQLAPAPWTRPR